MDTLAKRRGRPPKVRTDTSATSELFTATLTLGEQELTATGTTVQEALEALTKPKKITTKSVLTVTQGNKSHSRNLTIPLAKRLFMPISQMGLAKGIALQLK
jgi:hypothetical protein